MVNPLQQMDGDVHFRKSMCKFAGCPDETLSVLEYSKPYAFGKLNAELSGGVLTHHAGDQRLRHIGAS